MGALMAEMLGKREGCCRGRGGSMHLFDRERRFYGGNAIVGGGLPLAVGIALADKRLRPGASPPASSARARSARARSTRRMNLAELWQLPVLFVCENNLYAMGVPLDGREAETDIWRKAAAYRMPAEQVDGMDPVAGRGRGAARGRAHARRPRARTSSNAAPTASARIRCSTPRPTARATRSRAGSSATRSSGCAPG